MQTFTLGFTQKSAEQFFGLLRQHQVRRLLDVRLNNVSQLAGFAKKNDLIFFLKELCQIDYIHLPELTPTASLLKAYQNKELPWPDYAARFVDLLGQRQIERVLDADLFDQGCLLCSEHQPHFCHRRLVLEYLNQNGQATIDAVHLT